MKDYFDSLFESMICEYLVEGLPFSVVLKTEELVAERELIELLKTQFPKFVNLKIADDVLNQENWEINMTENHPIGVATISLPFGEKIFDVIFDGSSIVALVTAKGIPIIQRPEEANISTASDADVKRKAFFKEAEKTFKDLGFATITQEGLERSYSEFQRNNPEMNIKIPKYKDD